MRDHLLSAATGIALMASGAVVHEEPATLMQSLGEHHHLIVATDADMQRTPLRTATQTGTCSSPCECQSDTM